MSTSHIRSYLKSWAVRSVAVFVLFGTIVVVEAAPKNKTKGSNRNQANKKVLMTTEITRPCRKDEKWKMGQDLKGKVSESTLKTFKAFLRGRDPGVSGLSEGKQLSKSKDRVIESFGLYWMGRGFFADELYGPAIKHLNTLVAQTPDSSTVRIQIAAIACLEEIHRIFPVRVFTDRTEARLKNYFKGGLVPKALKPILYEAGVHAVMHGLQSGKSNTLLNEFIELLDGSGPYQQYARAVWAVQRRQVAEAVAPLKKLAKAKNLPQTIALRQNELRLILAQILYNKGKYRQATRYIDAVDTKSNFIVQALSQRPWIDIAQGKYSRAVGASLALQSGAMKSTFAPEALMVAAMSLNELCLFPESLHMLQIFKREYRSSVFWLRKQTRKKGRKKLYPLVISFLKGNEVDVPVRVAMEWIRSPVFLSNQQAINKTFSQKRSIDGRIKKAKKYKSQKAWALGTLRLKIARAIAKEEALIDGTVALKAKKVAKKALRLASSKWRILSRKRKASSRQTAEAKKQTKAVAAATKRRDGSNLKIEKLNDSLAKAQDAVKKAIAKELKTKKALTSFGFG